MNEKFGNDEEKMVENRMCPSVFAKNLIVLVHSKESRTKAHNHKWFLSIHMVTRISRIKRSKNYDFDFEERSGALIEFEIEKETLIN